MSGFCFHQKFAVIDNKTDVSHPSVILQSCVLLKAAFQHSQLVVSWDDMKNKVGTDTIYVRTNETCWWNITECSGRGSSKYDRSLLPNVEPRDADTPAPGGEHVVVHGSETMVTYTRPSHKRSSLTHISLQHQPLSLCCVQPVGLGQEPFLERIPVYLQEKPATQTHWHSLRESVMEENLPWRGQDGEWKVPVNLTACPGGSSADSGLLSLHSAPVRSAPKCRPPPASELRCHSQCGCEIVPSQCPCRGHRTSPSRQQ